MNSIEFWDKIFSQGQNSKYSCVEMPDLNDPILQTALRYFGEVKGKKIIDIGCGSGKASLFFAYHSLNVISIDSSEVAINNLSKHCAENKINNIIPVHLSAQEISKLGKVDFVFGSMILHHIEPFEEFAATLKNTIKINGKAFFQENSAQSKLLIWFRQNIVGKFWIPKYGDEDEFPLTPDEINELKKYFHVEIEYPELLFFRLISSYLLRGHFKTPFEKFDDFFYKFHKIRKYSYRQYLYLS